MSEPLKYREVGTAKGGCPIWPSEPEALLAKHIATCEQCSGPDDGCEEGQALEEAILRQSCRASAPPASEHAILYLDNLEIQHCDTFAEVVTASDKSGARPYAILRRSDRKGRPVWHVRNVHYRDNL